MAVVLFVWLLLFVVFSLLNVVLHRVEVKSMTLDKFKEKFSSYVERKDGDGAVAFLKRNFVFILRNRQAISEWVRATYPDCNLKI